MKRIKLKESDLLKIIRRTLNESQLLNEGPICASEGKSGGCSGYGCHKDATWQDCSICGGSGACVCQNPNGGHCGSVIPSSGGYDDEVARPMTSDCPDGCYDDGKKCWCDEWYTEKPRPVREAEGLSDDFMRDIPYDDPKPEGKWVCHPGKGHCVKIDQRKIIAGQLDVPLYGGLFGKRRCNKNC